MSLLFSPPCRLEERNLLFPERHYFPPHSSILPEEGRWTPDIYNCANFYEKASCIPHRDGQQVIIYWMPDECYNWRETAARGVKRLKKMYEKLYRNYPRIVRYNGPLDGPIGGEYGEKIGGLLVEQLTPGPFQYLDLPAFVNPKSPTSSEEDMLILSLYYRWALQSLSAISYLHTQGVFLRVFSSQMVWLRSDFSLAITGFINAIHLSEFTYTSDIRGYYTSEEYNAELAREDDGMICDEWLTYQDENGSEVPGVEEDLFQWATFVWRLMTIGEQLHPHWLWDPNSPRPDDPIADYGQNKDTLEAAMRERDASGNMWQELEEERLGRVLVKAWNGGYESAGDVMADVRAIAVSTGVTAHEDEVSIDQVWEDVFEVVQQGDGPWERELRVRMPIVKRMFEEWVKI